MCRLSKSAFLLVAVSLLWAAGRPTAHGLRRFPNTILWAWERPEDLRSIDPRETGVAFLASAVFLRDGRVVVRPRLQPLRIPDGTALMAVTRLETDGKLAAALAPEAAAAVADTARLREVRAIQVDFDARASEHAFYKQMLVDLRRRLPESMPVSITALASWCLDAGGWLDALPIDEAVPMLFRMGEGGHRVLARLESGGDFSAAACRGSLGVSTDEPLRARPRGRRVYIFHPRAWTRAELRR